MRVEFQDSALGECAAQNRSHSFGHRGSERRAGRYPFYRANRRIRILHPLFEPDNGGCYIRIPVRAPAAPKIRGTPAQKFPGWLCSPFLCHSRDQRITEKQGLP